MLDSLTEQVTESKSSFVPKQPKVSVLDFILTVIFGICFFILLLVWDLVQRVSYYCFGERALHRVDRTLNWLILTLLRITGASFESINPFVFPNTESHILVSNHQSMFDICMLHELVWQHTPRFISKKELGKWIPGISFNLRAGGQPLIDRSNAAEALSKIDQFGKRLNNESFSTIIFPEGTRARDGVLKKFKPSGLVTLLNNAPNVKVVIVVIDGSWRFQTYSCWPIPLGSKVRMEVIDVIDRAPGLTSEAIVAECQKQIGEKLINLRKITSYK